MPKLYDLNQNFEMKVPASNFIFSAIKPENLTATEYTLVTITVDISGSVDTFASELLVALQEAVRACKKSPKSENILLRIITFNQMVQEIHGFIPLESIDPAQYAVLRCTGGTALYDAVHASLGAARAYARVLVQQDYAVNCINFIITDGEDNSSTMTPVSIKGLSTDLVRGEEFDSMVSVLIGINSAACTNYLDSFKNQAGLDQFVDMGDVSPAKLARLGGFISRSISSQSQNIGSGSAAKLDDLTF